MIKNKNTPLREKINADIEAFLANGGKVQQLEYAPDSFSETVMNEAEAKRLAEARKRGSNTANWKKQSVAQYNNQDVSSETQRKRAQAKANRFKKTEAAA